MTPLLLWAVQHPLCRRRQQTEPCKQQQHGNIHTTLNRS
jgi:hypothetical protein